MTNQREIITVRYKEENMKKEVFKGIFNSIRVRFQEVKESEKMKEISVKIAKYAGKAYRLVKKVFKSEWKNVVLAAGTTLAAATVTTGIGSAVMVSTFSYASIKGVSHYYKNKGNYSLLDASLSMLKDLSLGYIYSYSFFCSIFYVSFYFIESASNVLLLAADNWVYLAYLFLA